MTLKEQLEKYNRDAVSHSILWREIYPELLKAVEFWDKLSNIKVDTQESNHTLLNKKRSDINKMYGETK